MTQKQRAELETIYWDLTRSERKLAAILSEEEKKWSNLGGGSGVLLETTPVGEKIDSQTINLDEAHRAVGVGLEAFRIVLASLAQSKAELESLRPTK